MTTGQGAEGNAAVPLAVKIVGYVGAGLSAAGAVACAALAVVGAARGAGAMLLYGLLFLPVALLGLAQFCGFLRLRDWVVAPEVPLGVKLLGHLGRIIGSLATASCVALVVTTAVLPKDPRPGLAALFLLGIFVSLLVGTLGAAISELRTWARPGTLIALGLGVALLAVALVLNLTTWKAAGATLPLAIGLGASGLLFLFLLVYFMLPPVVEAFEARRL